METADWTNLSEETAMQNQYVRDNLQLAILRLFEDEIYVSLRLAERVTQLCTGRLTYTGTVTFVNRRKSVIRVGRTRPVSYMEL
ncbi:hypothetical protein CDAR_582311 [Caerostris darwini]|uniref:Uncharacterized protein n=1 Tax=Caerostris darwini TaxID=1538125 RepID=A0AAV4RG42_9ARAC|nr:hypothetical protein CDAR_582311 [Caerostris darwini]